MWSDGMSRVGIQVIYHSGARWRCQMGTAQVEFLLKMERGLSHLVGAAA